MFKFKQNIANVSNYSISIYGLVTEKKKILFLNDFEIDENVLGHISHGDSIFSYHEVSGKVVTKKYNNRGWEKLDFPLGSPFLDKSIYLIQSELDSSRKKWTYFLYDIKEKKKIFHSKEYYFFGYPLRKQENLYHVDEDLKTIKNLHLPTETTLWQYDTSVLGIEKIGKILGVFGEVLVVVGDYTKPRLDYQDHYEKILGLDIKTGELLYEISEFEVNDEQHLLQALWNNWVFNNEETQLYALAGNHFYCLDSQSGNLKVHSVKETADDAAINGLMSSSIQGQQLAFRAFTNLWEGFPNTVGIFNIKTKKIEWVNVFDEFREQGGSVKNTQPKISGNKVYALDTNNTLHIFERE